MHRRTWDAQTNARMVLAGIQGKPGADICHEHPRSHSPYDQWRDQFLAHAAQAFEAPQHTRTEAR
jgi:transposase-like protein